MSKIVWDDTGKKLFETGVDRGVLYKRDTNGAYTNGVAWNGLTAVNESPSGAEPTNLWADNTKYLSIVGAEEFGCSIEAYTYPDEFAECDGSAELTTGVTIGQQNRKSFGFCYRTLLGNDVEGVSSRGKRAINSDLAVRDFEGGGVADLHGQGGGDASAGNVVLTHDDLSFLIKVLKIRLSLEVLSSTSIVP